MHKVKWYGVSVVLLLLSNTTPVWARFGGGHGRGASGVSGYSRGAPNWLAWLGLLILIGVILKAPWHLPHRYQRVTVAERQAITQLFQRYQAAWASGDISSLRPEMAALAYTKNEARLAKLTARGKREIIKNIRVRRVVVQRDQQNARVRTYRISGTMVDVVVDTTAYAHARTRWHRATYFKDEWTIDFGFANELRVMAIKPLLTI